MTESHYWTLLLVIDGLLMFMGLHLILGAISEKQRWGSYHNARIITGTAFIITPIAGFVYYYLILRGLAYPELASSVNLTAFYATATLFAISFLVLIGKKYDNPKAKYSLMFGIFLLFLFFTWGGIIVQDGALIRLGHIIANGILFIVVLLVGSIIYKIYSRTNSQLDNYYSDDMLSHMAWIGRSLYLFAGLGIIACISPFSNYYSLYISSVYLIYQAGVYMYIYNSMRRFELSTLTLLEKCDEEVLYQNSTAPMKIVAINHETTLNIENAIMKWISQGGYCERGITVRSVALDICTNRTYLSSYINTVYGFTFKDWIAHLRIDEAKRLLSDCEEYNISDIAVQLGFSNLALFIHTFTKLEGESPSKWKANNLISDDRANNARSL